MEIHADATQPYKTQAVTDNANLTTFHTETCWLTVGLEVERGEPTGVVENQAWRLEPPRTTNSQSTFNIIQSTHVAANHTPAPQQKDRSKTINVMLH